MRALQQNGLSKSKVQQTNGGVKLTTFIPVRFVRHKAKKVVIEPTMAGKLATPIHPGKAPTVDENLMKAAATRRGQGGEHHRAGPVVLHPEPLAG